MVEPNDSPKALLGQLAAEEVFFDRLLEAEDGPPSGAAAAPSSSPVVSLMITGRQRDMLCKLGFSDESIRFMTPAEAHIQLGMIRPRDFSAG
jgi:hypothetical protein